ncbi:MAG: hypothetical protein KBA66_00765 [Leptospiraceae bacterium]|nr:hypothetical protein [Leptospiraceae bacterium]
MTNRILLNNLLIAILIFSYLLVCKKASNENNEHNLIEQKDEPDIDEEIFPTQITKPEIKLLVGDWAEIPKKRKVDNSDYAFLDFEDNYYTKISFYSNMIYKDVSGFQTQIGNSMGPDMNLGNKTVFQIIGNELQIFDLRKSNWVRQKILKLDSQSLVLKSEQGKIVKYKKLQPNKNLNPDFEKIIFSSSKCFGTCPVMDIIVSANGDVVFYGERFNLTEGIYSGKISPKKYKEILDDFRFFDIQKSEGYATPGTDQQTRTITFIHNNKIYKTIRDYGHAAPSELKWGYTILQSLYQKMKLRDISLYSLPIYNQLKNFEIRKGDKTYYLEKSESFYLWDLLRKGKITKENFTPIYILDYEKESYWQKEGEYAFNSRVEEVKTIKLCETDGRFFKFSFFNKDSVTIDIGFDFFKDFNLDEKFKHGL